MKEMQVAEDIVPVGEFKSKTGRIVRQVRESGRPVVITQNGRPAAVLVSPADFDQFREHDRFLAAVHEGLADAEAGRVFTEEQIDEALEREST